MRQAKDGPVRPAETRGIRAVLPGLCLLALTASFASAQDERVIRPEDFDRTFEPARPESRADPAKLPERKIKISQETTVLVDELKGVRFVPHPDEVVEVADQQGVTIKDIPLLDTEEFREQIKPYLGKPVTMRLISFMIRDTILYYQAQDRPVVDVFVPEQEITKGVVQLLVVEARVNEVKVEGFEWFSEEQVRDAVRVQQGDVINAPKLLKDIDYINKNPFRFSRPVLEPGEEFGTTDVIIEGKDRFPVRFYAGYEDTGSRATDLERVFFGVNLGNVWDLGHEAGYQYTTNGSFNALGIHSAYYRIPLPNRDTLAFFGNWVDYTISRSNSELGSTNWMAHVRYISDFPDYGNLRHSMEVGFDFRRADNDLQVGGRTVFDDYVDVAQFALQYGGRARDDLGDTSFTLNGYWAPVEDLVSSHQDDEHWRQAREDSNATYFYFHGAAERIWILPEEWEFHNRLTVQLATARLPTLELLGVGGYNTVRGFDDREINTDTGLITSFELRTPRIPIEFENEWNMPSYLQFLTFIDYGYARNCGSAELERRYYDLMSVGAGVRFRLSDLVTLRFDYGHKLEDVHDSPSGDGRVHLYVMFSY